MPNQIFPLGHAKSRGPESHIVKAREAAAMVRAHHNELAGIGMAVDGFHSIKFHGEALEQLKQVEGYAGIQISKAINAGRATVVVFAVDAGGGVIGSIALENGEPCPPFCKPSPSQPE